MCSKRSHGGGKCSYGGGILVVLGLGGFLGNHVELGGLDGGAGGGCYGGEGGGAGHEGGEEEGDGLAVLHFDILYL